MSRVPRLTLGKGLSLGIPGSRYCISRHLPIQSHRNCIFPRRDAETQRNITFSLISFCMLCWSSLLGVSSCSFVYEKRASCDFADYLDRVGMDGAQNHAGQDLKRRSNSVIIIAEKRTQASQISPVLTRLTLWIRLIWIFGKITRYDFLKWQRGPIGVKS